MKSQKIICVVGVPGSGKSHVCEKLTDKFHYIHHDGFIYLKEPGAYVRAILEQAPKAEKTVLIEAPFSVSETVEPLEEAGYVVTPVYIVEDPEVLKHRYENDPKRVYKPLPKGHITRMKTYAERAKLGNRFSGTSDEVLAHLRSME